MSMESDYQAMTDGGYQNPYIKNNRARAQAGTRASLDTTPLSTNKVPNAVGETLAGFVKQMKINDYNKRLGNKEGLGMTATPNEINQMRNNNQGLRDVMSKVTPDIKSSASGDNSIFVTHEDHNLGKGFYNPYTKLYGSKATRNNNPGNISGMGGKLSYGASRIATSGSGDKGDQSQLVFNNPNEGWNAMKTLMSSEKYNNAPIKDAFSKYQSDQNAWGRIKNELTKSGVDINKRFNDLTPQQQATFMNNRAKHEGFKGNPFSI